MRKTIRLTGRRQLPVTAFDFQLAELHGKRFATLTVVDHSSLKTFPPDAEVRVRLAENKLVEILRFGTVGNPSSTAEVNETSFLAPSCQVRIVGQATAAEGMLLGSTTTWTYKSDADTDGILLFQPADTKPRPWKLDIRDEERPILYIDERVTDAASWAKTDPVFIGCVFPHVINEVFRVVLRETAKPEDGWMTEWLAWAGVLMPGSAPPFDDTDKEQANWIDQLIDTFSAKHNLADGILKKLEPTT